ncbi:hypothetical protein [Companilactobacillus ginsenosidimutans]|uniref:Uncharacterized protein n=1 Tax=Companilactobacillus ginsenosidimutans TaxID=1007676 RepID=A0A0H4QKH9_9LACO|nr:hypothetical protein [Companilactobacillus ginsenosidimutans]AKP67218.1 hypothetical protein ABM34_06490 [Companilactobacillus ginsenosidimutans]
MTSFKDFFKVSMADKFREMNFILLINLLAVVVSAIWILVTGHFSNDTFLQVTLSWSFFAMFVAFIRLTVRHEKTYTRDSYRLIPIGDTKFYLTNLLTSFVGFIYVGVIELAAFALTAAFNWQNYMDSLNLVTMMNGQTDVPWNKLIVGMLLMILLMVGVLILTWSTISLIHLLTRVGNSFLPYSRSRIISFIVYVVVILVVLRIVGYVMNFMQDSIFMMNNSGDAWSFTLNLLGILVLAALEIVLNIYLMSRWVETVSES